jgi:hypothetical protein
METESYQRLPAANFRFALYASGEYSRKLESEWGDGVADCGFPAG